MSDEEFIAEMMSDSRLQRIPHFLYKNKLSSKQVSNAVAMGLLNKHKDRKNLTCPQIEDLLPKSDKDLFLQLRENQITMKQFQARVYEKGGTAKYTVLDDIIDDLEEVVKLRMSTQKHQPYSKEDQAKFGNDWEVNKRCLHSMRYHHKKTKAPKRVHKSTSRAAPKQDDKPCPEPPKSKEEPKKAQSKFVED